MAITSTRTSRFVGGGSGRGRGDRYDESAHRFYTFIFFRAGQREESELRTVPIESNGGEQRNAKKKKRLKKTKKKKEKQWSPPEKENQKSKRRRRKREKREKKAQSRDSGLATIMCGCERA